MVARMSRLTSSAMTSTGHWVRLPNVAHPSARDRYTRGWHFRPPLYVGEIAMDKVQRKLILIGIVTEICGNKIVRVFDDQRLEGGYMVSTHDPDGVTADEIREIDWQVGGLDLEVSHVAEGHPTKTVWLKP